MVCPTPRGPCVPLCLSSQAMPALVAAESLTQCSTVLAARLSVAWSRCGYLECLPRVKKSVLKYFRSPFVTTYEIFLLQVIQLKNLRYLQTPSSQENQVLRYSYPPGHSMLLSLTKPSHSADNPSGHIIFTHSLVQAEQTKHCH